MERTEMVKVILRVVEKIIVKFPIRICNGKGQVNKRNHGNINHRKVEGLCCIQQSLIPLHQLLG